MRQFDINKMRASCKLAAEVLASAGTMIQPGITTDDINRHVHNLIVKRGAYPAPLNYRGFPRSVCTSVNEVVCHGIPGSLILRDGDIVNVDVTTILDGHFGDTNATFFVGEPSDEVRRLVEVTHLCLNAGICAVEPGSDIRLIGRRIQEIAEDYGYGVVKEFGGHGVGVRFHSKPHVNHFDDDDRESFILQPGMTFTIEPMINMGTDEVWLGSDGWTVKTADGKPSAQFEQTLLVTDGGHEILTTL